MLCLQRVNDCVVYKEWMCCLQGVNDYAVNKEWMTMLCVQRVNDCVVCVYKEWMTVVRVYKEWMTVLCASTKSEWLCCVLTQRQACGEVSAQWSVLPAGIQGRGVQDYKGEHNSCLATTGMVGWLHSDKTKWIRKTPCDQLFWHWSLYTTPPPTHQVYQGAIFVCTRSFWFKILAVTDRVVDSIVHLSSTNFYFTWSVIRLSNLYLFRWQKSAKTALDFASALCSSDRVGFCCAVAELTTLHRTACLCVTLHVTVDSNKWGTWGCMCGSSVLVAWGFSPVAQNSALWNKSHRCTNAYIHTQTSRKISYPQTAVLLLWWCGTILTFPGNVFCLGIAGDSGVNTDLRYACFML